MVNWNLIILLALLFGGIGLLPVVVAFGVRRAQRHFGGSLPVSTSLGEVLEVERERIKKRAVCSDKTHWH